MIAKRPADQRGHADHGWLQSWHSFSFADYYDPAEMGWGALRVINEDIVAPGSGFPMHGHRNMEIVTVVLEGALEHRDSLGNGAVIRPGEVQRMSAGRGVRHSEFNPSASEPVHLLQIWIEPAESGGEASWEQREVPLATGWTLLASPDAAAGSVRIGQQARLLRGRLAAGETLAHSLPAAGRGYVQMIAGELAVNGVVLAAGDGARIADERELAFISSAATNAGADFLLFELPA